MRRGACASVSRCSSSANFTATVFRCSKAWDGFRCLLVDEKQKSARRLTLDRRLTTRAGEGSVEGSNNGSLMDGSSLMQDKPFCIIDGPETVMDFARLQLREIHDNIKNRRNTIFLLLEEIRRLRIQMRMKSSEDSSGQGENETQVFSSFIPFLPPLTSKTLRQYYATCLLLMAGIIVFGGLIAPMLEVKLGPGGTSYKDFISFAHLPTQLSEVDPIVASFTGGAVGVISSLIVVEINNVKQQEQKTCKYCHGTGYLACARCSATGVSASNIIPIDCGSGEQSLLAPTQRCLNCSGAAKVMCPTCLCTGMAMANESNPRIDPFD